MDEPFDKKRYQQALKYSALVEDIN